MKAAAQRRRSHGFTLIEMMVVLAIMGILAAGLFPLAELNARRDREQELRQGLRQIREAIDAYKAAVDDGRIAKNADASGYPASLDVLVQGTVDVKNPSGQKIYFLRRLPGDPFMAALETNPARTWGLRSYASPPESPAPGVDVFDVYPLSEGTGLNGVPYRQW